MDTPGKAAYLKWKELIPVGAGYPLWTDLPTVAKNGWEDIARAAVHAFAQRHHADGGNARWLEDA